MKTIFKYSIAIVLLLGSFSASAQTMRKRTTMLMGSRFDFTIVAIDSLTAEQRIDEAIAEIVRIENLISDWKPESQVSEVNQNAGIRAVKVDLEVLELTQRAIGISVLTSGAFDISFAAMERIWKFDGSMTTMPTPEAVRKSVAKVGYQNILVDTIQSTLYLKLPGMKIGFGSIGKGYAADMAKALMQSKGVKAGIINASGDMATWGHQTDGTPWNIGITDPMDTNDLIAVIPLSNEAVTTSGSYEKFAEIDGQRYSHIINPVTGYPASGLVSVTVIGPNAERCNAFSTSLMVMGKKAGLRLINQYKDYSCLMITEKGKVIKSRHFKSKLYPGS